MKVGVGSEDESVGDDFDQELDDEHGSETDFCDVEPSSSTKTVFRVEVLAVDWCGDGCDGDASDDGEVDDYLEDEA